MSEKVYPVKADWAKGAWIDDAKYQELYKRSVTDPNGFWGEAGKRLDWIKPYTRVKNTSFDPGNVSIKWFEDGTLNLSANCIDRHLATRGDQVAIIWESDDPTLDEQITYNQLHERVCRFANVLKAPRRQEGRSRHHLSADDPRSRVRDARLCAHRRHSLDRFRRLLTRQLEKPRR